VAFIGREYQTKIGPLQKALIDMRVSPPSQPCNADREDQKVAPGSAIRAAEHQRKIAIGWLYLVDITSDDILRASYERLARRHFRLADAEAASVGPG
jgi:hypothetical protein